MSAALELLAELPPWIQAPVFGGEVPRMDTDAGRRVSAEWRRSAEELERLVEQIDEQIATLPDAVREALGSQITTAAADLRKVAAARAELCAQLAQYTDTSSTESDKAVYTMAAFGFMTGYQVLAAGLNPVAQSVVLEAARTRHLAFYATVVAERISAGAAAMAERAVLLGMRAGGFAALTGGVDAGVQLGQMLRLLNGHRESMDWASVVTSAVAGAGAAVGGMLGGRIAHAVVPQAESAMLGRAAVAALAGMSGVIGGAAAAAGMTGRFEVTLSALAGGAAVGMAAAHAQPRSPADGAPPTPVEGTFPDGYPVDHLTREVREYGVRAGAEAAEYRRINSLREQELAETRADGAAVEGSRSGVSGPGVDAAELARRVTARDAARAELAHALGMTPEELRSCGRPALERAVGEVDSWLGSLGDEGWARLDPAVRDGVLGDLPKRVADRARAIAEGDQDSAPVSEWLRQAGLAEPHPEPAPGQWSALRQIAAAHGAERVGQVLDGLARYGAADAEVGALDRHATDTVPQSATDTSVHANRSAAVEVGDRSSHGDAAVVAEKPGATAEAGPDAVERSVRELGVQEGADAVVRARASDFEVLQKESAHAGSALAKWLGLSDTEFHSMRPSQLRSAVEHWVGRAEGSSELGEQARPHAGTLIGDEVRRAVEADKHSGRLLVGGDELAAAQAIPTDLQGRLRHWVGGDAAIMERWTDVHATLDRMLSSPNSLLRLGASEGTTTPEDPALGRAQQLYELELAQTAHADGTALTPEAAQALAAAGFGPSVAPPAATPGGMSALTPAAADALAAAGLGPSPVPAATPGGMSALTPAAAKALAAAGLRPSAPPEPAPAGGHGGDKGPGTQASSDAPKEGVPGASEGSGAPTPAARDASAAAGLRPSAEETAGAGDPPRPSSLSGAENDGTKQYSAPDAAPAGLSDRGAVQVLEQEVPVQSAPADPVREAASAQAREYHERELAETEQARKPATTPPGGPTAVPHANPAEPTAEALPKTSGPQAEPGVAPATVAHTSDPQAGPLPFKPAAAAGMPDPHAGAYAPESGAPAAGPHPAHPIEATAGHGDTTSPTGLRHQPLIPGAAMSGAAVAASDDEDSSNGIAAQLDSAGAPLSPALESPADVPASESASAPDPDSTGVSREGDAADPRAVRQEHSEATAGAAELLGMSPQELRFSGWRLLAAAVDRVEAGLAALGDHGWDLLTPEVRSALLDDLGEVIGRELRDQADTHRRAAAVLEWLRAAGLSEDGTSATAGQRFSLLRQLAEDHPASPIGHLVEALERFRATGTRFEALPTAPTDTPDVASPSAENTRQAEAPAPGRRELKLGGSWWFGSPLRAEWIRLGMERATVAWELAREHGLEFEHWALRPGSPELDRLRAELSTATGELAERFAVDPDELSPRRIEQLLAESPDEHDDFEHLSALANRCLLLSALLETAAAFERVHVRATAGGTRRPGVERNWLQRILRMDLGELSRRWRALQAGPAAGVRPPGISSRYAGAPAPLHCLPIGRWQRAGEGSNDSLSHGTGRSRAPDMPHPPRPIDCAPLVAKYLVEENGSAAVAENLAAVPLTPNAELGGTTVAQVQSALGGAAWEPVATWDELANRLGGMAPGTAAYVVTEDDRARAAAGSGHARLVFHDRRQPGVVKWRDPEVDGGAKHVFEAGKLPEHVYKFAIICGASGDALPRSPQRPKSVVPLRRTPLLAVAGTDGRAADPPPHEPLRPALETTLAALGSLARDVVVVGSSAMAAAFPGGTRPPHDTDVSVSEGGFRRLREQGWTERRFPDGFVLVTNGEIEAAVGWGGISHDDLLMRAWRTRSGLHVAGLSDVTAAKWRRGLPKDFRDLEWVRSALLDPRRAPLPEAVLDRQIRKVRATLPEWVLDHPYAPVAVRLAADGMYAVNALYGDPEVGAILPIVGELEKAEFLVPASYHNGFGLEDDLQRLQDHMENIRAGALDRLLAMAADANSDLRFGGGRMADNPEAYDELVSATILRERALVLAPEARDEARLLFEAVENTAFDQHTGEQKGRFHPNPVVRAVCGIDLQHLSEYNALAAAAALAPEDLASRRTNAFYSQILSRVLIQESARITSPEEAARFLHENRDRRPVLENGRQSEYTLGQALGRFYRGNAKFVHPHLGYRYPMEWSLEDIGLRLEHSKRSELIGDNLLSGRWTPRDAEEEIAKHTEIMRRRTQRRLERPRPIVERPEPTPVDGTADSDWAANVLRIARDMTGGDHLAAAMYRNRLAEIRSRYGDDAPRRTLAVARRAAAARAGKLSAELDQAAAMHGAQVDRLVPNSEYLAQWLREFESKALELADSLLAAWRANPDRKWQGGWDEPGSRQRLAEHLSRYRGGPQSVLRIVKYFQHGLRDLPPGRWPQVFRDTPDRGPARLPEWLMLAIVETHKALTLADILDVPDPDTEEDAESDWIVDAVAEWRVLGAALGRSSEAGRVIEQVTEYLELARLVDIPPRLDEERRLLAQFGEMERELGTEPTAADQETPATHTVSRDIDTLARLRGLRDRWLELCGEDSADPSHSAPRLRREFEDLTTALTADLRKAGMLASDDRLTPHLVRRIETDYDTERQQALLGTRGNKKTAALRDLPGRLARYRRLEQSLRYIAECERWEALIDDRLAWLRGDHEGRSIGSRRADQDPRRWLPVADPKQFRPERAAALHEWGARIAAAAGERRRRFETVVRRARRLGVQNPEQSSPEELRWAVDELIDWAADFRAAAPHPPGVEIDQAQAARVGALGDIVRRDLVLFGHALAAERGTRAEAAAAIARDMLAQNVIDAEGGRRLAPQVAVVEAESVPAEVYVAGPVATLDSVLDAVAPDVRAALSAQGARFHYTEVTVDEQGRAYLRDVQPAFEPVVVEGDSDPGGSSAAASVVVTPGSSAESARDHAPREEWAAAHAAVERQLDSWRLAGAEGERITDCVAFLPSGAGGQLVVAAPVGMHRRVLLDVVTKDARFTAARWHPRFDRQYVEVTPGPDGPVATTISARTAEGRFREATDAELEGILLDEYLRFRRLGLITATFRDWIGELGKHLFYGKKEARRSRATRGEVVAGHLKRDGTLQAFACAAAESNTVVSTDLPHPTAVLIRAVTRTIPLPPAPDGMSDAPVRVVLRAEVDLGALRPTVEIAADGLLWRVAPPRGHGDAGDVLNRWLQGESGIGDAGVAEQVRQGMWDRDPDRLLRRIEEAAAAGAVPTRTQVSASPEPRHFWELSATAGSREFTVNVSYAEQGWWAVPTPRAERDGGLEPIVEPVLPSLLWRVGAQVREAARDSAARAPVDLDLTLSHADVRRYDELIRDAAVAASRLSAWRRAEEALAVRLGVSELDDHDPETLAALSDRVRDERASLADELGVDPVEIASIPLSDSTSGARRDEVMRREAELREYADLRARRADAAAESSEAQRRRDSFLTDRVVAADLRVRGAGRRVGEGIGYVADRAGGLLLVAAPPGGHLASLLRQAAERPEYADALWRDELEKRYLEVTAGPDGRIEVRTVPAAEAEGRRRKQSGPEIPAQLLDHYLNYRTAGATALGFGRWLGLLAVENPLGDVERLAWLGHQMVRAEPKIERTHPAHVLHRLWTRRVPPLPAPPTDLPERPDIVLVQANIGDTMAVRLPLEHEDGMWRVVPDSASEVGNVLARHFPELSATSPDTLVQRIDAFLLENVMWDPAAAHQLSSAPGACFPVAAVAAMQGPGLRPRFDIPRDLLDNVPVAGFDGRDISRWAHAHWRPGGFRDAAAIVAHVRRTDGTVLGAVDFGPTGAHAFTVRRDAGVTVVTEQVARLDIGGAVYTTKRVVRGEEAVDAWAAELTRTAGAAATFHGIAFTSVGIPELPLGPDREPVGRRGREFPIRPLRGRPPERAPPEDGPGRVRQVAARDLGEARRQREVAADRLSARASRLGMASFEPDGAALESVRQRADRARADLVRLLGADPVARAYLEEPVERLQGRLRSLDDAGWTRAAQADPAALRTWIADATRLENDTQEATTRAIEGDTGLAASLPARRAAVTSRLVGLTGAPRPAAHPSGGDPLAELRRLAAVACPETARLVTAVVEYLEFDALTADVAECVQLDRLIDGYADRRNPLLHREGPWDSPRLDRVEVAHIVPAVAQAVEWWLADIAVVLEMISDADRWTFDEIFDRYLMAGSEVRPVLLAARIINNSDPEGHPGIREAWTRTSRIVAEARHTIQTNLELGAWIRDMYGRRPTPTSDPRRRALLERVYLEFQTAGMNLPEAERTRIARIDARVEELKTAFQANKAAALEAAAVPVTESELAGVSVGDPGIAATGAGGYLLRLESLMTGSFQPWLTRLRDGTLRRRVYDASVGLCRGGEYDNTEIVTEIVALRAERAALLGFPHHAAFVASQEPVAPETATAILEKLTPYVAARTRGEMREAAAAIDRNPLQPWDVRYGREVAMERRSGNDDRAIGRYLELDQVLTKGVFRLYERLFGITFRERSDLPAHHPDIRAFDVTNAVGESLGLVYYDPYQRPGKQGGGITFPLIDKFEPLGRRPVSVIFTSIAKPADDTAPTLLTWQQVLSVFHEFGHGVHDMLGEGAHEVSGRRIPRTWVEGPGMLAEVFARLCLSEYAFHHDTGAPMPAEMMEKIRQSTRNYRGMEVSVQIALALLDLAWHRLTPAEVPSGDDLPTAVREFENSVLTAAGLDLPGLLDVGPIQTFGHMFALDYHGAYFTYQWSEIFADIVRGRLERLVDSAGGFTREVGDWLEENIFRHQELFLDKVIANFLDPDTDLRPYLEANGLIDTPPDGMAPVGAAGDDPGARLAMARRAGEQAARRRSELAELITLRRVDPRELLRTGSPTWAAWFSQFRKVRDGLIDMLGLGRGRAVSDGFIHHVLAERQERGLATSEHMVTAQKFTEMAVVAELIDDIRRLDARAHTVEAVEAELARRAGDAYQLIVRASGLMRAVADFRPLGGLTEVIGATLAAAERRLGAWQRLGGLARDVFALASTLEAYEEESFLYPQAELLSAARRYRSSSWASRSGMLLLHARLSHLLTTAQDSEGPVPSPDEQLSRLAPRVAAAVEHYETIERLNADLDSALAQLNRELSGVPVAPEEPARPRLSDSAEFPEIMSAVREHVTRRRQRAFTALSGGLSSEFALDIAQFDEPDAGAHVLSRLTRVPPGESERLDTTIRLIHELGRGRRQLTQIDTIVAAMDEADHRTRLGDERLARLVSEHVRRYPLDRRISRGGLDPDPMTMDAMARACAAALPGDRWTESGLEAVRERVAALRRDTDSPRATYLAERYLGLRQLIEAFHDESPWRGWHLNVESHVWRLGRLLRGRDEAQVRREAAEHRLRRLAPRFGLDLTRGDEFPQTRDSLRRMVKRDLRWLTLVLSPVAAAELRWQDPVSAADLDLAAVRLALERVHLRQADTHPRRAEVRERVEQCLGRTALLAAIEDFLDRTAEIDRYDAGLDKSLHAAMAAVGHAGGPAIDPVDLERADITALQRAMTEGVVTSAGLVEAYLHRIRILDSEGPRLNAVRTVNPKAMAEAERLDAERRAGHVRGPLHGIPILIKDNIDLEGLSTTAGAVALQDSYPGGDAFLVRRLRDAGAIILGKTNMTELANFMSDYMPFGYSSLGKDIRNPYRFATRLGGSSSGSAVAAAAALAAATIGTETAGSIMSPAVFSSMVGIKPTVGLISRTGIFPSAASLDTAGPIARTVRDAATLLTVLAAADPEDAATTRVVGAHGTDYVAALSPDALRGVRIGVVSQPLDNLPEPVFAAAAAVFSAQGAELISVEISVGGLPDPLYVYEMKRDVDRYLSGLPVGAPIRSLDDLIRFNRANAYIHGTTLYSQNRLLRAAAIDLDDPAMMDEYRAHRERVVGTARERLDTAFQAHRLDAVLFIGDAGSSAGRPGTVSRCRVAYRLQPGKPRTGGNHAGGPSFHGGVAIGLRVCL
ncbi:amidase family protein [Nocardia sp. N2S4-5]|uniref:amidase family protein n=1 Tax=Nocardia sp. N2S4-5 TaxID=3351565 RepID=UPI0037D036BE